jgi:hypothetical protein
MAFDSDVLAKSFNASASAQNVNNNNTRLKGVMISPDGTNDGSIVFKNNAATIMTTNVQGGGSDFTLGIPEQGVRFATNLNVTVTNCSCTVFYTG